MDVPFVFGKVVSSPDFTDRAEERARLKGNFLAGINTVLISPRRWGKSSLVHAVVNEIAEEKADIICCQMDLFSIDTEQEFYQMYVTEVLRATMNKVDKMQEALRMFLSRFIPRLSYGIEGMADVSISLDWKEVIKTPDEVLDLPERIAESRGLKVIICLDEFQNISSFSKGISFQKKLRAKWQRHKHVSYCVYGSKRHMMMEVFTNQSMPFYKFGDLIFLEKIKMPDWVSYITNRFEETRKIILPEQAREIVDICACHPHYVQQLAQLVWLRSGKKCRNSDIAAAAESLILQLGSLFQMITENLSRTQVNFLIAIAGGEVRFSTKEVLEKYELSSTANVARIKKALLEKEIIDYAGNVPAFTDPIYGKWVKEVYLSARGYAVPATE